MKEKARECFARHFEINRATDSLLEVLEGRHGARAMKSPLLIRENLCSSVALHLLFDDYSLVTRSSPWRKRNS